MECPASSSGSVAYHLPLRAYAVKHTRHNAARANLFRGADPESPKLCPPPPSNKYISEFPCNNRPWRSESVSTNAFCRPAMKIENLSNLSKPHRVKRREDAAAKTRSRIWIYLSRPRATIFPSNYVRQGLEEREGAVTNRFLRKVVEERSDRKAEVLLQFLLGALSESYEKFHAYECILWMARRFTSRLKLRCFSRGRKKMKKKRKREKKISRNVNVKEEDNKPWPNYPERDENTIFFLPFFFISQINERIERGRNRNKTEGESKVSA